MTKGKVARFEEFSSFSNSLEYTDKQAAEKLVAIISNYKKVVVELAAGKADYSVELAKLDPDTLHIAVDIQGERLWKGAKKAIAENIDNVYFLRIYIEQLAEYFPEDSIDDIWITFPDPFPKDRHEKRRLTSPRFINMYRELLKPRGSVHLKTDDKDFFKYSVEIITAGKLKIEALHENIYEKKVDNPLLYIQTDFEKKHLAKGRSINYVSFGYK